MLRGLSSGIILGMLGISRAIFLRGSTQRFHSRVSQLKMSYLAVHVQSYVKTSSEALFYAKALQASTNMLPLQGVLRYDILRNNDDPRKFLLVKVFENVKSLDEHKTTQFYKDWTEQAEPLMEEARATARFNTLFPTGRSCWSSQSAMSSSSKTSPVEPPIHTQDIETSAAQGLLAVVVDIHV